MLESSGRLIDESTNCSKIFWEPENLSTMQCGGFISIENTIRQFDGMELFYFMARWEGNTKNWIKFNFKSHLSFHKI